MLLLITNPRFRLLWTNYTIAGLSGFMYMMVHQWLTLEITDSPFWVGVVSGVSGVAFMCVSIAGGVLADRLSRRNLIVSSGLVYSVIAGLLAVVFFIGEIQLWHVIVVAAALGVAVGIRTPAYMAIVLDVVARDRLLSANAANYAGAGTAGIIAPLLGGFVVDTLDFGWAYVIIAAFELVAALVLLQLSGRPELSRGSVPVARAVASREPPWTALKEGVRYVFSEPTVRALILLALVGELFVWGPHMSMLPVMARDVLGVGVTGLGYLKSASFAGFLFTNLAVSAVRDIRRKGRVMVLGSGGFGLFLVLFAISRSFPLSLALLAVAYGVAALYDSTLTTLVQTIVPDEKRGRVVSFQAFTWGVSGLAGFPTGAIASFLGAPIAIIMGAGVFLVYVLRMVPMASRFAEDRPDVVDEGE